MRHQAVLIVCATIIISALIVFGALPRITQERALVDHTKQQVGQAMSVSVVQAQPGPAIETFTLPGSTEAIQDAPIYARVNGYLHQRYANIGDVVKKGQILADIDTPEVDQQVSAASSNVEQAKAALDNAKEALTKSQADERTASSNVTKAKTDLDYAADEDRRYKELAKQGAVSLEDEDTRHQTYNDAMSTLDGAQSAQRSAHASVNSARAAVHVAQASLNAVQAQLQQFRATQSFKRVVALFDGVVTRRNVDAGALITSGSNSSNSILFEIAKTDVLRVIVYVPEQYVPYIKDGENAHLRFQEYANREFDGTIANVSGGVDPTSRTLQVEIHIPNSKHELLPGMYAQVSFQAPKKVRLPVVPATTLQTRADGGFMYTVDQNNIVHMHKVEIARDLGGQFEVMRGIGIGDLVIVSPSDRLQEGMTVTPVKTAASQDESGKPKS
jgi:RND family efflux transporter MFP subunit